MPRNQPEIRFSSKKNERGNALNTLSELDLSIMSCFYPKQSSVWDATLYQTVFNFSLRLSKAMKHLV